MPFLCLLLPHGRVLQLPKPVEPSVVPSLKKSCCTFKHYYNTQNFNLNSTDIATVSKNTKYINLNYRKMFLKEKSIKRVQCFSLSSCHENVTLHFIQNMRGSCSKRFVQAEAKSKHVSV